MFTVVCVLVARDNYPWQGELHFLYSFSQAQKELREIEKVSMGKGRIEICIRGIYVSSSGDSVYRVLRNRARPVQEG